VVIDLLDTLFPHDIPAEISLTESQILSTPFGLDRTPLGRSTSKDRPVLSNAFALQELEVALDKTSVSPAAASTKDSQLDDLAHDEYFHIRRVANDNPAIFIRTAIKARIIILKEVLYAPVTLSHRKLDLIDRALADLAACLVGGYVNGGSYVTLWECRGVQRHAMPRWIRGHQAFAALTQGLIFSFRQLGEALRTGDSHQVRRWADLCVVLFRGSAATFELTGDFPVEDYANVVRPSMMPPASEVGLSGLMSVDHRYLVQLMRDMRPALKSLGEQEPAIHGDLAASLGEVYDSHIHVCERFVGARPSILTAGRTERSGPSLIEQFKSLRLKPFEQVVRAQRLSRDPLLAETHSKDPRGSDPHQKRVGGCPFHE
jgi:hypothetical protein